MMWEIYRERGERPLCPKVAKQQAMLPGRRAGLGKHRHRAGGPTAESGRQAARGRAILCPCQGAHHPHFGEVHQAVLGVIGSALFNERQVREVHAQVRDARRVTTERQKRDIQPAGQRQQGWFPKMNTLYLLKNGFFGPFCILLCLSGIPRAGNPSTPPPCQGPWGFSAHLGVGQGTPACRPSVSCWPRAWLLPRQHLRGQGCVPPAPLALLSRSLPGGSARAGQGPPGLQPAGGSSRGNLLFQSFPQVFKSSF